MNENTRYIKEHLAYAQRHCINCQCELHRIAKRPEGAEGRQA